MCDQDWTEQLLRIQRDRIRDYEDWGVTISRNEDGSIRRFASRGMIKVRAMQYKPKEAMRELRRRIADKGVRIIDRVCITELLTSDGRWPTQGAIIGAVGFHVHTGSFVVIRAKQTIVATGMLAMKGVHGVDNDTGDGVAMAYRAGVRMVDMEFTFGGTFNVLMKQFHFPSYNVAVAHGARLINARGERFMERYDPVRLERSELSHVVAAFAKELLDGNGPVYVDLRHVDESYWRDIAALHHGASVLLSDRVPDPRVNPLPIEPTWGLWAGGRSGLSIDLECRSSMPGLLGAGASAKNDAVGTHASAGSPTAFCKVSGWIAGQTAARAAAGMAMPELPMDAVAALREAAFAPLSRRSNTTKRADDLHDELARLEANLIDGMILREDRLQRMVAVVAGVAEASRQVAAADLHDLVKVHEAGNVAECAGMVYRAALDRTESREQFYREDHPNTDPAWFCWHGLRRTETGEVFDRARIPLERFKLQPEHEATGLSPIGGIMTGRFAEVSHV